MMMMIIIIVVASIIMTTIETACQGTVTSYVNRGLMSLPTMSISDNEAKRAAHHGC